jgi:hypothetical protein
MGSCLKPGREGKFYLWDVFESGIDAGPEEERWCVEWHPGGRKKSKMVYLPTFKVARRCYQSLRAGEPDQWGLFDTISGQAGRPVGKKEVATTSGGNPPAAPPMSLTAALHEKYTPDKIIGYIDLLLNAKKPIYGSENGTQKVVAWEPDVVAVSNGLKLLLSYKEGTPVKRTEDIKRHEASAADIINSIQTKPGYRHALMGLIKSVEERQSRRLADLARPAEVEEVFEDEE